MQNEAHRLTLVRKLMMKILNLGLMILLKYQNIKTFLQKTMFHIGMRKFLEVLEMLKALCRGRMLLVILKTKKLWERFTKKNCKKQIKMSLELKK